VMKHRRNQSVLIFDCGETNGAQAYAHCKDQEMECVAYLGMDGSSKKTEEKQLSFFNKRSETLWRFREALDPGQDGGSPIQLPDDPELVSDLTAVRWELTKGGIKATPKDIVVKELGRSPDRGDAVVMAWSAGPKMITHFHEWRPDQRVGPGRSHKRKPSVNMGARHRSRSRH